MEAFIIWPPITDSWVVTQRDFEQLSSCTRRRVRKRSNICHSTTHIGSSDLSSVSIRSKSCRCLAFLRSAYGDFEYGFFPRYSSLQVNLFYVPQRCRSLGAYFTVPWALQEQEIGNEIGKELLNPLDGLSENDDKEGANDVSSDRVKDSGMHTSDGRNYSSEKNLENTEIEKDLGEEGSTRIDVRALAWSLRFVKTADDVEAIMQDKGELPLQVYSSMIRGFGKEKMLNAAIALVEWLKRRKKDSDVFVGPNLFIYNSLLGAVKQAEQFEEMEKVMNDMSKEGVHPNIVTYNTLMGIYLERGKEAKALDLFEEIQKNGLSPSPASYSTVLLAYRRLEDGFGALKFYVEIRDRYQKGEIGKDAGEDWQNEFAKLDNFTIRICYQVMRRWLVRNGNFSTNVLKLLKDMDKAGLQAGRSEYERLVWACTREEHYAVAKELYKRIREQSSEISLSVCNHVIWLMGKAKKWWAALEIYEDLLDKGPKPNNMSYELMVSHFNILLTAARKRGIWRWGVRLLNKMEEKGLKPGGREWNSVLVACSKASEASAAVQIFQRMVENGDKPTIISYGALLSALEKGKLYEEALQVWKHMIKVGVEPNLYAYTIMASIYVGQKKFNIVDSIIQEMVASNLEPTVVTFNAIISGCGKNNMGSEAYEWFQRMKSMNLMPNEITYEVLIEALAADGKPRLAFDMYLRACNEGLILSPKAYDAVIHASHVYGASIDVGAIGPRPPEKKKKMLQSRNTSSEFL